MVHKLFCPNVEKAFLVGQALLKLKDPVNYKCNIQIEKCSFELDDSDEYLWKDGWMPKVVAEVLDPNERAQMLECLEFIKSFGCKSRFGNEKPLGLKNVGNFENMEKYAFSRDESEHFCEGTYAEKVHIDVVLRKIKDPVVRSMVSNLFHSGRHWWLLSTISQEVIPRTVCLAIGWMIASDIYAKLQEKPILPEDRSNFIHIRDDGSQIETMIPNYVAKKMSSKERNCALSRIEYMEKVGSKDPLEEDEFYKNNPGIIPKRLAMLLPKAEREGLITSMLDRWGTEIQDLLTKCGRKEFPLSEHGGHTLIPYLDLDNSIDPPCCAEVLQERGLVKLGRSKLLPNDTGALKDNAVIEPPPSKKPRTLVKDTQYHKYYLDFNYKPLNLSDGSGSILERMELKEALRYFFNHPKACLIAKTLLWLKAPQNKNRVGWASFQVKNGPECLPDPDLTSVIEDEFVKANLSMVPVEVAYLLSQEDRRNLVNCLMDTSADKTLCPVGINYAERKLAMCKSTNRDIEQILPCDCEKTFLESFPIQKWISFLDKSDVRRNTLGYIMNPTSPAFFEDEHWELMNLHEIPRHIGIALGIKKLKKVCGVLQQQSSVAHFNSENEAELHAKAHDLKIPVHILRVLTPEELESVKKTIVFHHLDAKNDPFLINNLGLIPLKVAEWLTKDERKRISRKLLNLWSDAQV